MPEATCVDAIANSVVGIGSGAAFSTLSFGMLVWSVQLLRRTRSPLRFRRTIDGRGGSLATGRWSVGTAIVTTYSLDHRVQQA